MSVEIKEVSKLYGTQKALDQVTFTLRKGELAGFLGPNGAGKSTLMKIITGYLHSDGGEVVVNGTRVTASEVEVKRLIGYLPENNPLYSDLYVSEYLEIAAGFYKIARSRQRVREMIAATGLEREQHKMIGALSKGYRQRVGLAQAMLHDPPVLILDEPTTGLDPNQLGEIRSLIKEISREKTVLLSSHILQEIEAICQRVVIIHKGILVADSELTHLKEISLVRGQQVFAEFDKPVTPVLLREIAGVATVRQEGKGWLMSAEPGADVRPGIFRFAVTSGVTLLSLTERQQNLEDVFQSLTRS